MLDSILHPVDPGRVETNSSSSADALHFTLEAMFGNVDYHNLFPNFVANTNIPKSSQIYRKRGPPWCRMPDFFWGADSLVFNPYKNPKFGTTSFSAAGFPPPVAFLVPNQPAFSGSAGSVSPSFFCCSNVARYSLFNFRPVV